MLSNRPITKADIIRAEDILGPHLGSLKEKQQRKTVTSNNEHMQRTA